MPDAQRAELVSHAVTRAHRNAQQTAADGVPCAEQTLHARFQERRVRFRGE